MKDIILAGRSGTRLYPILNNIIVVYLHKGMNKGIDND